MDYAVEIVDSGGTYETEYDGRSYEICFFCDAKLSEGEPHACNCAYIAAKESEEWVVEESRRRRLAQSKPKQLRERVSCPNCGRYVTKIGLDDHIRDTGCNT